MIFTIYKIPGNLFPVGPCRDNMKESWDRRLKFELSDCLKIVTIYLNFVIKILTRRVLLHLDNNTIRKNAKIQSYWFLFF